MGNTLDNKTNNCKELNDDIISRCRAISGLTENQIRQYHTKYFTIAPDGRLKKSQMHHLLADYIPPAKNKHLQYLIDCIFSAANANEDGNVDFLEYIISLRFFQTKSPIEKAHFMFRIMDKDGNDNVSKTELKRILRSFYEYHRMLDHHNSTNIPAEDLQSKASSMFDKLDKDKSGCISLSEFMDGWFKNEDIRALFNFEDFCQ